MTKSKDKKPVADHGLEFFAIARAQAARVLGTPSGDAVLDRLGVYHPTGPARLEEHLKGLEIGQALRMCLIDWWTGGELAAPGGGLGGRFRRMVHDKDPELDAKVNDLPWLEHLGSVKLAQDIPARRVPWQTCQQLIARAERLTVRSIGQVHDLATTIMEPRHANHLIRLLRPVYGELPDKDWAHVTPAAACGVAWAAKGHPLGLHPSAARQEAALTLARGLLDRSRDPALWPENDYPFSIDNLLLFAEFVWTYLKSRYPHLKDPPVVGRSK